MLKQYILNHQDLPITNQNLSNCKMLYMKTAERMHFTPLIQAFCPEPKNYKENI